MNTLDEVLAQMQRHIDEATLLTLNALRDLSLTAKQDVAMKALARHLTMARAASIVADNAAASPHDEPVAWGMRPQLTARPPLKSFRRPR